MRLIAFRGLALAAVLLLATSLLALKFLQQGNLRAYVGVFMGQIGIYGFAAWVLLRASAPPSELSALVAVLLVAAGLRGIALFTPQVLTTDAYRYVWDGRVQNAGENPYRYIPADPALAQLRDAAIYPNINRAGYAHTIYPPTAQMVFRAAQWLGDDILAMKLVMVAFDALSIAGLIGLLRHYGMPPTRVLLYAWHPLPIWEFAGSGHVDAVAIAMLLLALLFAARRSPVWAGVALAAAALVKYYPIVIAPALYRRWDRRLPLAFLATLVLLYLPYIGVGRSVFGFLPGYANEEGLNSGGGFFLWALLQHFIDVPADGLHYYLPFAALCLLALASWLQFGGSRTAVEGIFAPSAALMLASGFTVLISPHQAWYFAWLVPFLCFRFSPAHLWLTGACSLIYVLPWPLTLSTQMLIYLPFLLLLVVQALAIPRQLETFDADPAKPRPVVQ